MLYICIADPVDCFVAPCKNGQTFDIPSEICAGEEIASSQIRGSEELFACADLQARTGEYSEKGAEVALVAGVVVLGLWATGILKTDGSDDPDVGRVKQK